MNVGIRGTRRWAGERLGAFAIQGSKTLLYRPVEFRQIPYQLEKN